MAPVLAIAVGVGILVSGYYIFEAIVYPVIATVIPFFGVTDAKAALAEIPLNLLQGVLSGIIAYGIYRVLYRNVDRKNYSPFNIKISHFSWLHIAGIY